MGRLPALAALLLLTLTVTASAGAATTHSTATAPPVQFTDENGDSGTAPDLKTVDVTNDDKGQYTFTVGFATPYGDTAGLILYLDTDQNAATGDPDALGADYLLGDDHSTHSFFLERWNGTDWEDASSTATVSVSISSDNSRVVASINKTDLGGSTGFNFFAVSVDGDGGDGHFDDAPSGSGSFTYTLQPTVTLALGGATALPVKAGGLWSVVMVVIRSDTGKTVGGEGAIVCRATSGSTKLAVVGHQFVSAGGGKGSGAVCLFKVPTKLKGKTLKATMTVSYSGQSVTHSFSTRAR